MSRQGGRHALTCQYTFFSHHIKALSLTTNCACLENTAHARVVPQIGTVCICSGYNVI